ncbi:MAG: DUF3859 domain-containing protein [Prolixibacteraceae bacterium]|nr:DUF3859 domain-containing protein [Prolixibacteraceae bacterium]
MAKRITIVKTVSYGEYTKWDRESRAIPKIVKFTTEIEAAVGTEFGYVLHIKNGKGKVLTFEINHPPFTDANGEISPPFTGQQFIRTNDFEFYLGDCIWEPLNDKLGDWEITTFLEGRMVAQKTFRLIKTENSRN